MNSVICVNCFSETGGQVPCPFCGFDPLQSTRNPQHLPLGALLAGRYRIGRTLGQGGFGITYLGLDIQSNLRIAIKEFFLNGVAVRQGLGVAVYSAQAQEQYNIGVNCFFREARILAQFNAHPNIVNVSAFFRENDTAYIVMEYIEGKSLKEYLIGRGGAISFVETQRILFPIMDALSDLHQAELLHRDVAPDNIYLTNNGAPKLLDFGAARLGLTEHTRSAATVIKPGYAPIEQYSGMKGQGPWTDVYAMGATFYRCLTGFAPIPAPERVTGRALNTPSMQGVWLPVEEEQAIMKALAILPEARFASMLAFKNALSIPMMESRVHFRKMVPAPAPMAGQESPQLAPMPIAPPTFRARHAKEKKKAYSLWLMLLVGLLALGGLIFFLSWETPTRQMEASATAYPLSEIIIVPETLPALPTVTAEPRPSLHLRSTAPVSSPTSFIPSITLQSGRLE